MVLRKEIALQIKDLLKENPQGLSITDIVKVIAINRNTAGRYLENLLISGQVEMRRLGMAKIYVLSQRVPLSAVLSISSELVMQMDSSLRIIFANEPFHKLIGTDGKSLVGKNIEYTPIALLFDDIFPGFLENIRKGLIGKEWAGEIVLTTKDLIFFCRIAPTVFDDGRKGVSVILEDITGEKRTELTLRESEDRYRKLVEISPDAVFLHREGKIIYANPAAFKLLGASHSDEIIGKNILGFIHPDFRDAVRKNIEKDLGGNITPPIELHMLRIDGASIIVEGRGVKTTIGGKPTVQVAIRDITERKRDEEALRESEGKLNAMLQSVPDIMSMMDKDLTIIWANEPAKRYFGKDILGKKCYEAYHLRPDLCEPCLTLKTFLDGKAHQHETTVIDSRGGERFFECMATVALRDNSGNPAAVLEISRDITDRKKAEEVLSESEGTFRSLVQESSDGIVIVNEEGRVIVWNNAVTQISGIPGDEALGNLYIDLVVSTIVPEQRGHDRIERIRTIIDEELQTGTSLFFSRSLEAEIIRRDGERRYIQQTAFPIRTAKGFRIGSIIRDITERKCAEVALRESEEKYRTLIDRANDGICVIQDKIIKMCNKYVSEFWGGSIEEILGRPFTDFIYPDALSEVLDRYNQRMGGESPPSLYQTILKRKDGSRFYAELNTGIISYEGEPANLVIIRDMNERKKVEAAMRESEEKYRTLIYMANDVISIIQEGIIKMCNPRLAEFWGGSIEEVMGKPFTDFIHPEALPVVIDRYNRRMAGESPPSLYETIFMRKDGSKSYVELNASIISYEGKKAELVIVRDINDRKKVTDALRESEEKYRTLVTATGDIVWETDAQAHFVYVSPQVESIIGYKPDELIGHTPFEFLKTDAIEPNQKMFRSAIEKREKSIIYISHWIHKDGYGVYLESHAVPIYRSDGSFSGFIGIDRKKTL